MCSTSIVFDKRGDIVWEGMVNQPQDYRRSSYHTNALDSEHFQKEIETAAGRRAKRGQAGKPVKGLDHDVSQGELL